MNNILSTIADEFDAVYSFCNAYDRIYLYGAGKIGLLYKKFLESKGIRVTGFIITAGTSNNVDNLGVYPISMIRNNMSEDVGVIATFRGARKEFIRNQVGNLPGVLLPKENLHTYFYLESNIISYIKDKSRQKSIIKPKSTWENILIIRLDVLGDLIMSTAFIRELKRSCPQSRISLVVRPSNALLFKDCPYISNLIIYDSSDIFGVETLSIEQLEQLRKKTKEFVEEKFTCKYDVVFQLCPILSGRGALEAIMLGCATGTDCQIGRVYAWENDIEIKNYLYKRFSNIMSYISYDVMPKHEVASMLDMLRCCGVSIVNERLELWNKDEEYFYESLMNEDERYTKTCIAVGIVGRLPAQCWPADWYSHVFDELIKKYNVCIILFGGNEAKETAVEIIKNVKSSEESLIDLTGKTTLNQAITIMKHCIGYFGANTGLMHMAAALALPIVEISFYVRGEDGVENSPMGPWGTKSIVLQKLGMDGCTEICSKPYSHCIKQITVPEVIEATEKILFNE